MSTAFAFLLSVLLISASVIGRQLLRWMDRPITLAEQHCDHADQAISWEDWAEREWEADVEWLWAHVNAALTGEQEEAA